MVLEAGGGLTEFVDEGELVILGSNADSVGEQVALVPGNLEHIRLASV